MEAAAELGIDRIRRVLTGISDINLIERDLVTTAPLCAALVVDQERHIQEVLPRLPVHANEWLLHHDRSNANSHDRQEACILVLAAVTARCSLCANKDHVPDASLEAREAAVPHQVLLLRARPHRALHLYIGGEAAARKARRRHAGDVLEEQQIMIHHNVPKRRRLRCGPEHPSVVSEPVVVRTNPEVLCGAPESIQGPWADRLGGLLSEDAPA
mmetsp:Transcript_112195/g.239619  ORF Transcript_112195/g.239619 Transcript_112195/m.239619 type:complete len:214 (+) Transcript_112195:549-1190(+)